MLSFSRGKPIAAICGGPFDKKILCITEEDSLPDRSPAEEDIFDLLDEDDLSEHPGRHKALKSFDQLKLKKALSLRMEPLDDHLIAAYRRTIGKINNKLKREIQLPNGLMFVLPDPDQTERVYIAGKSGSGKSTWAAIYMNEFLRMFPEKKIYLISRHDDEKTYSAIPHTPVPIDTFQDMDSDNKPIDLPDLANSLVVFDDCDNIQDKKISIAIKKLSDDIVSNGRKYGIYTIWLNHQLMEYTKTRNLLNEANKTVFFNSGSNYHVKQYLLRYVGLNLEQIAKILAIRSRWTMIALTLPMYILHEHGAYLL